MSLKEFTITVTSEDLRSELVIGRLVDFNSFKINLREKHYADSVVFKCGEDSFKLKSREGDSVMLRYNGKGFDVLTGDQDEKVRKLKANIEMEPVGVFHRKLQKVHEDKELPVECIFCLDGHFPVRRVTETNELLPDDSCLACGRQVIYLDIEEMQRKMDETED